MQGPLAAELIRQPLGCKLSVKSPRESVADESPPVLGSPSVYTLIYLGRDLDPMSKRLSTSPEPPEKDSGPHF